MKTIKLISVTFILTVILLAGCSKDYLNIEGSGPIISQELDIEDFTSISVVGKDNVYIQYGPEQKVVVTGHSNIIPLVKTRVVRGTWDLSLEDGRYNDYELSYHLTIPRLEKVKNTGIGNISIENFIPQNSISVSLTGTGNFNAFPLSVKECVIDISGTGNCELTIEERLDATITGTGNVYYKGTPLVKQKITGTGVVQQAAN